MRPRWRRCNPNSRRICSRTRRTGARSSCSTRRGSVIDEPVLLRYLQERRIAGAGLDVFVDEPRVPPEFFALDNAVIFPHVGSATVETRKAMGDLQIENLRLHFAGKPVLTRVV